MLIAGFQKLSMVDYPSEPCAVVFVPYCNMNCTYCHNAHILSGQVDLIPVNEVVSYLEKRRDLLRAVVVSGGEPTLQQGLEAFIATVRQLGYYVKLDTNGTRPDVLKRLLSVGYLDYVAMDLKASAEKYDAVTQTKNDISLIRRSVLLLMNSDIPYEFRTTFAPELSKNDLLSAVDLICVSFN